MTGGVEERLVGHPGHASGHGRQFIQQALFPSIAYNNRPFHFLGFLMSPTLTSRVAIIGGGPAGLMAAADNRDAGSKGGGHQKA
ncbi:hypothetical protein HUS85_32940 [Pseudomonas protegens]|uniref:hypothetical protein n=1 Tax=Pseudomonas protegens TaxID=380021 RepID=UPI001B337582|nr:hypothetical protein [Pseudomonas protegens]MBP5120629.1 hypothetical protein [Pseudomonas protegens]